MPSPSTCEHYSEVCVLSYNTFFCRIRSGQLIQTAVVDVVDDGEHECEAYQDARRPI